MKLFNSSKCLNECVLTGFRFTQSIKKVPGQRLCVSGRLKRIHILLVNNVETKENFDHDLKFQLLFTPSSAEI